MTVTATNAIVGTKVNATARSVTYVANELLRVGLEITASRGLMQGAFVDNYEHVEKGFRVWLATRQLEGIVIEFLDSEKRCVEVFELPIEYDPSNEDEHFDTQIDAIKAELGKRRSANIVRYRLIVVHPDVYISLPGWKSAERSDASKLKKRNVLMRLISTSDIKVHVYVYEGENEDEA